MTGFRLQKWTAPSGVQVLCVTTLFFFQDSSLFGLGDAFKDSCGTDKDTCMSLLSLQLLVLMIAKPMPKFFYDMVWP